MTLWFLYLSSKSYYFAIISLITMVIAGPEHWFSEKSKIKKGAFCCLKWPFGKKTAKAIGSVSLILALFAIVPVSSQFIPQVYFFQNITNSTALDWSITLLENNYHEEIKSKDLYHVLENKISDKYDIVIERKNTDWKCNTNQKTKYYCTLYEIQRNAHSRPSIQQLYEESLYALIESLDEYSYYDIPDHFMSNLLYETNIKQDRSKKFEINIDDNFIYMVFPEFNNENLEKFRSVKEILIKQENLILDLRGNPGGSHSVVIEIADFFISDGEISRSYYRQSYTDNLYIDTASSGNMGENINVIVLADNSSASASEVLINALRQSNRMTYIGETTYGKGVAQSCYFLNNYKNFCYTIAKLASSDGQNWHQKGIKPDIFIQNTENQDLQLETAIKIFNNISVPIAPM